MAECNTGPVQVSAIYVNYQNPNEITAFLNDKRLDKTQFLCNSVDSEQSAHYSFPESALLIGKSMVWNNEIPERPYKINLEKAKNGAHTSHFRFPARVVIEVETPNSRKNQLTRRMTSNHLADVDDMEKRIHYAFIQKSSPKRVEFR
jgi:hypothetical protein